MSLLRLLTLFCCCFVAARAFKILGICPSTSYSHQQPFQALMKALAARGHEVTVISPIPLKEAVKNYRDIDVSFTYRKKDCTGLRSNVSFDGIVIEQLWFQCYYSLVKRYNFPVLIGFLSVGNLPYAMDSVGNPDDPILNPDMAFHFTNRMNTIESLTNILYTTATRLYYKNWHLPMAQRIASKIEPDTSVSEIDRNFSLVILGNNHVFGYSKPLLPNVIEVHSLQIGGKLVNLPRDIQDFLDNSKDGAIYFSLGSNLQTHQLPADALTALLAALGSLKQRILWKHRGNGTREYGDSGSNEDMLARARNIKFVEWAPQQAVLAHPKILAYVMQGGLQSLQEAVYYGVPLVAIPFFGDQNFNARKILDAEIGLTLDVDTMTSDIVARTITEVVENEKYRRNIKMMSDITKDELVRPMDRAVWSIEHVLKFPHSRHFRYHGRDITYFQYYSPILILLALGIIFLLIMCIILSKVWTIVRQIVHNFSQLKSQTIGWTKKKN